MIPLCEEVVQSNSSVEEKLRAIREEFRLAGRRSGGLAGTIAEECIDEINCALRRHSREPELNDLVYRYDNYLFDLNKGAYG